MQNRYFSRAMMQLGLYRKAIETYGQAVNELNLSDKVFAEPMNLIPVAEVSLWYLELEKLTNDPDFVIKMIKNEKIDKMGPISHWIFSGSDLATTIRRINTGISCLQSGAFLAGEKVGPLLKWVYENPSIDAKAKTHDSVRIAVFMTKVLRRYLGTGFNPIRVMLPGTGLNLGIYQDFFQCDIGWNHSKAEIWFNDNERFTLSHVNVSAKVPLAMSFADLDDLLNMPDPADEIKVIYETINYSRHLGVPSVDNVSRLMGLSKQQFSRRLHSLGINFTTISSYVLSNLAVNLFIRGYSIEQVSASLGYTHVASFSRMFKNNRGLTPLQFLDRQH